MAIQKINEIKKLFILKDHSIEKCLAKLARKDREEDRENTNHKIGNKKK